MGNIAIDRANNAASKTRRLDSITIKNLAPLWDMKNVPLRRIAVSLGQQDGAGVGIKARELGLSSRRNGGMWRVHDVTIIPALMRGLGIEDMVVLGICTDAEGRQAISLMRENGVLNEIYSIEGANQ